MRLTPTLLALGTLAVPFPAFACGGACPPEVAAILPAVLFVLCAAVAGMFFGAKALVGRFL